VSVEKTFGLESLRDTFPEACFAPVNSVVDASQLAARFFTIVFALAVGYTRSG